MATDPSTPQDEWVTDEMLGRLVEPKAVETYEHGAMSIFRQNAVEAAKAICKLATHSTNDRIRLDAAKYVSDRVLGRISEARPTDAAGAPWESVYEAVVREPTATERESGAQVAR
jgi:hypothetical protein